MKVFNHFIKDKFSKNSYELVPLTLENLSDACIMIADSFASYNPLCIASKVKSENFIRYVIQIGELAVDDGLGIICKDSKTSQIIGACIFCDSTRIIKNFEDLDDSIREFLNFKNSFQFKIENQKIFEAVDLVFLAVQKEYRQKGIAKEMLKFATETHPATSKSRILYTYSADTFLWRILKKLDWKVERIKNPKEFVNFNGIKQFENYESCAKELDLLQLEGLSLIKREKNELIEQLLQFHIC